MGNLNEPDLNSIERIIQMQTKNIPKTERHRKQQKLGRMLKNLGLYFEYYENPSLEEVSIEELVLYDEMQLMFNQVIEKKTDPHDFPQLFTKPLYKLTRVYDLNSFAIISADVKITPDNEVKIIELNGIESGMLGFARADVKKTLAKKYCGSRKFRKPYLSKLPFNPCESHLDAHLKSFGMGQLTYMGMCLASQGRWPLRFGAPAKLLSVPKLAEKRKDIVRYFFDNVHVNWGAHLNTLAIQLIHLENMLDNKATIESYFVAAPDLRPETYLIDEENKENIEQLVSTKDTVLKPLTGRGGNGIVLCKAGGSVNISFIIKFNKLDTPYLVEEFVPSKKILNEKTNEYHDGCMRYIMVLEEDQKGRITPFHFGGYWRLAPHSLDTGFSRESRLANLGKNAIPKKANEDELTLVRETLEAHLPDMYTAMIYDVREEIKGTDAEKMLNSLYLTS